jgi:hypothetical protein
MRFPVTLIRHPTFILLLGVTLPGCGEDRPPTYPVRGRVVFADGKPVQTGVVELLSTEFGETASGRIADDGTFVLGTFAEDDGACAGEHQAIVIQMIINDGVTTHNRDHGPAVDPMFATYERSNLKVQVEPIEQNEIEIVVQTRK